MRKGVIILFMSLMFINLVSATCNLQVSLLNQDPYPAVPGEYVKLVFQVSGLENPECKNIHFELVPEYPIKLDPQASSKVEIKGGRTLTDFSNHIQIPYKVRLDEDALDGDNPIEVRFTSSANSQFYIQKQFNISVEDVRADFEVYVSDYNFATNTISFEILNIGEDDIEALTVEVPEQDNIQIQGANRNIVGDLDSNDYTTADFEAIANDGEISLLLYYTDQIGVRRTKQEVVTFQKQPFMSRLENQQTTSPWVYVVLVLVFLIIIYFIFRWRKRKKQKHHPSNH